MQIFKEREREKKNHAFLYLKIEQKVKSSQERCFNYFAFYTCTPFILFKQIASIKIESELHEPINIVLQKTKE